jgi:parallel beta-helix repeat protein
MSFYGQTGGISRTLRLITTKGQRIGDDDLFARAFKIVKYNIICSKMCISKNINEKVLIERSYYEKIMRTCLLLILIPILLLGCANASTVTVGPKDADYSQIQQAIDNSSPGDVIEVQSGVYHENVRVYTPLTLQGIDSGNGRPVVDAGGSGSVISILSNGTIVKGFNITGSGGCGCGNAGIMVASSNNIIQGNIIYKNKYGIYIHSGNENNTFLSNDLLENNITVSDSGSKNRWNGSEKAEGLQSFIELISGPQVKGNHYSDYDEVKEGCNDANQDKICDNPRKIGGGSDTDNYPSASQIN